MEDGKNVGLIVMEIRKQVNNCQFGDLREELMLHLLIRDVEEVVLRLKQRILICL